MPVADVDAWLEAFRRESGKLRFWRVVELPDTPEAVPLLCHALEDDDAQVRWAAAEALGRIGDPRALGPLRKEITRSASGGSSQRQLVTCRCLLAFRTMGLFSFLWFAPVLEQVPAPLRGTFALTYFLCWLLVVFQFWLVDVKGVSKRTRARRSAIRGLVRITEAHATAEVQQSLPELRAMAANPLVYDRGTRRACREAARRIQVLTAHIRSLPVPAAPEPTGADILPRTVETTPEPDTAALPCVPGDR